MRQIFLQSVIWYKLTTDENQNILDEKQENATSPQKEGYRNWKTTSNWVKVLYLTILFHVRALILLSSHKHTHPSCSVPLSSTLITDIKTCQNDWCIEGCCHLSTVMRYFFILLCRLGTNLGVLTPVMSWQSALSSLNLWYTSHPFYIVDVLWLLSSGEGSSWTESTLRSQPVCWAQVWPGVPGLLCRWSPGQPNHNHTANQMWVENQSITDENWL